MGVACEVVRLLFFLWLRCVVFMMMDKGSKNGICVQVKCVTEMPTRMSEGKGWEVFFVCSI